MKMKFDLQFTHLFSPSELLYGYTLLVFIAFGIMLRVSVGVVVKKNTQQEVMN